MLLAAAHCKPKPCIAHRELPVSQFPKGKTCFHYREPLFSLQGPCFHYRDFPVNHCTSLLGSAVYNTIKVKDVLICLRNLHLNYMTHSSQSASLLSLSSYICTITYMYGCTSFPSDCWLPKILLIHFPWLDTERHRDWTPFFSFASRVLMSFLWGVLSTSFLVYFIVQ